MSPQVSMFQLSNELQGLIYEFDSTFHQVFKSILNDLMKWRETWLHKSLARHAIPERIRSESHWNDEYDLKLIDFQFIEHTVYRFFPVSKWRLYLLYAYCDESDKTIEFTSCPYCLTETEHQWFGYETYGYYMPFDEDDPGDYYFSYTRPEPLRPEPLRPERLIQNADYEDEDGYEENWFVTYKCRTR